MTFIFSIFFIILFFALAILIIVIGLVNRMRNALKNGLSRKNKNERTRQDNSNMESKKKIFADNEGEYVDYEEIK